MIFALAQTAAPPADPVAADALAASAPRTVDRAMRVDPALVPSKVETWAIERPFDVGDQIVLDDYEGTVEWIETRATIITTFDGRRFILPNADVYSNADRPTRRSQYDGRIDMPFPRRRGAEPPRDREPARRPFGNGEARR